MLACLSTAIILADMSLLGPRKPNACFIALTARLPRILLGGMA